MVTNSTPAVEIKKQITFFFSLENRTYTRENKAYWIKHLNDKYHSMLVAHEKLQLIANQNEQDIDSLLNNFPLLLKEIEKYRLDMSFIDKKLFLYHESQMFSILTYSTYTLVINKQINKANIIFGSYFGIKSEILLRESNCYIIPNGHNGVHFCTSSNMVLIPRDVESTLPKMTMAGNEFLSINNAFSNFPDIVLIDYARMGHPNIEKANEFYDVICNYFSFETSQLKENLEGCSGYYLLFGNQLPIQAIMSRKLGLTIPIVHSFQEPEKAREFKKVFIWQGFTQLAEIERLGLESVFGKFGVEVTVKICDHSTKEEFLTHYYSDDYDAFWITGQGQFNHYESHNSYLDLGNDITIRIGEIKPYQTSKAGRRLLFLNACDGATSVFHNSPLALGIGNSLIGKNQSLYSHNWSVENVSCLIFSMLVAINLSQNPDYSLGYQKSIEIFLNGKGEVIKLVSAFCSEKEVIDRINYKEFDYQNFYYWGSLAYLI